MGIEPIDPRGVHARAVGALGLDPDAIDLTSVEALAAALRRAAAFHCPASPATLLRAVLRPLEGIVTDLDSIRAVAEETLDAITAHGDLLESRDVATVADTPGTNLLYLAPPSFVMRRNGSAIMLGIASERVSALTADLERNLLYDRHVRHLPASHAELRARLLDLGLLELSAEAWLRSPAQEDAAVHVARLNAQLAGCALLVSPVEGMRLLDPSTPVRYYPGRWTEEVAGKACCVGRRPQAYGADLWCYVEMQDGRPRRFLDLPLPKSRFRGCDEAWQLQAALDATRGTPQQYRLRPAEHGFTVFDFFSPLPMWVRRRLDAIGMPVAPRNCLLSYRVPAAEVDEEKAYLLNQLWLTETTD